MSQTSDYAIEVRGLKKQLGGKEVLRGVDLSICRGETMVIIGQSGCGKSVLLKHIVGLHYPDDGEVFIDGKPLNGVSSAERLALLSEFGMLFQGASLFDSLTIAENVVFRHIQSRRYSQKEMDRIVDEKLEMVGLSGVAHLKPAELSGGMQKRVGLARAIAADPKFILYDEPTTGLDPIMADQINDLILHMKDMLNVTSIAVTHDMVSAYKISDRISMLYQGEVIETDTPERIQRSKNPYVRQFIRGEAYGPITTVRPFGRTAPSGTKGGKHETPQ